MSIAQILMIYLRFFKIYLSRLTQSAKFAAMIELQKTRKGFFDMLPKYNAFQLKLFMAILMVFDHIDHIHNNIFFPLALGVLMLCVLAGSDPLPLRICGVVFLVLFASIFAEGGIVVLPFMLITYLCRDRILLRNLLYLALGALLFVMSFVPYPTLSETLTMLTRSLCSRWSSPSWPCTTAPAAPKPHSPSTFSTYSIRFTCGSSV